MADEQENTEQSSEQSTQTQTENESAAQKGANTEANTKRTLPEALRKNLWQPGQSGNLSGRPKKKPLTELYEKMLNDPAFVASIQEAATKAVRKGQMAMVLQLKEMADRVEGKVSQPIDANVNVGLSERLEAARKRLSES